MKKILILFLSILSSSFVFAQDGSKLPLSINLEDFPQEYPASAKVQMAGKIHQMLTANGISSSDMNCNFFITVIANPVEKQVIPGAPAQILQSLEFTFYIADAAREIVFSTVSLSSKGVGTTEAKCYLDAMKRLNTSSPDVAKFLERGRKKIIAYYDTEASNIFAKARTYALKHEYDAAFYELCCFPTECESYQASLELGLDIYHQYVDYVAQYNLNQARMAWAASQNATGAEIAGVYLAEILPEASCYNEAVSLYNEIKSKVYEDWKWEMKKYQDAVDIEKRQIDAWKEVGVAYGKNQQPTTNYFPWLNGR